MRLGDFGEFAERFLCGTDRLAPAFEFVGCHGIFPPFSSWSLFHAGGTIAPNWLNTRANRSGSGPAYAKTLPLGGASPTEPSGRSKRMRWSVKHSQCFHSGWNQRVSVLAKTRRMALSIWAIPDASTDAHHFSTQAAVFEYGGFSQSLRPNQGLESVVCPRMGSLS